MTSGLARKVAGECSWLNNPGVFVARIRHTAEILTDSLTMNDPFALMDPIGGSGLDARFAGAAADVSERSSENDSAADETDSRTYRLAELRRRKELTQRQVAMELGVRQPRVSQLEACDLSRIEIGTLRAYLDALGGSICVTVIFDDEKLVLES